jgi:hypothetical protein
LDISDYFLLFVQLHPPVLALLFLLLNLPFDQFPLTLLVSSYLFDQGLQNCIRLRTYLHMVHLDLVLFEKIFQHKFTALGIVHQSVSLQQGVDFLLGEVRLCDLIFRETLDASDYLLV